MTVTVMTTTGGPESSDDCLRETVTGDEKLPPPTAVTAWICEYGMGLVVHNLHTNTGPFKNNCLSFLQ